MRPNWLVSKAASTLFPYSGVVMSSAFVVVCFLSIPGVPQFLNASLAKDFFVILVAALVILTIPSMLAIFIGMAIFCASVEKVSVGAKMLWFVLFLATGPIGSTVYYFVVYRSQIKRKAWPPNENTAPAGIES